MKMTMKQQQQIPIQEIHNNIDEQNYNKNLNDIYNQSYYYTTKLLVTGLYSNNFPLVFSPGFLCSSCRKWSLYLFSSLSNTHSIIDLTLLVARLACSFTYSVMDWSSSLAMNESL